MKRLILLDSLRGIAALIVFFHHIFLNFNPMFKNINSEDVYKTLNVISDLNVEAVLFFFIISGFSINISLRNHKLENNKDTNIYLYKRFRRILPAYILAIILTFIIGYIRNKTYLPDFNLKNLIGNLLFLQTSKNVGEYWFSPYGLNGPLWSLSYEMFYYLIYPVLFRLVKKINLKFPQVNFYDLAFLIIIPISILSILLRKIFFTPWFSFATYLYVWYLGVYTSSIYLKQNKYSFLKIIYIALFAIIIKFTNQYLHSTTIDNLFSSSVIFLVGIVFFKSRFFFIKIGFHKIESGFNFIFKHVGMGSYVLYIFHFPILVFISENYKINGASLFIISLFIIILSIFTEKKLIKYKYSFFKLKFLTEKDE